MLQLQLEFVFRVVSFFVHDIYFGFSDRRVLPRVHSRVAFRVYNFILHIRRDAPNSFSVRLRIVPERLSRRKMFTSEMCLGLIIGFSAVSQRHTGGDSLISVPGAKLNWKPSCVALEFLATAAEQCWWCGAVISAKYRENFGPADVLCAFGARK